MERNSYYVVTYSWDPAALDRIREIYPEHRAHVDQLGEQGGLWLTGVLDDGHALAIFHDEAAARAFLTSDSYARSGVVSIDEPRRWTPIEYPGGQVATSKECFVPVGVFEKCSRLPFGTAAEVGGQL